MLKSLNITQEYTTKTAKSRYSNGGESRVHTDIRNSAGFIQLAGTILTTARRIGRNETSNIRDS